MVNENAEKDHGIEITIDEGPSASQVPEIKLTHNFHLGDITWVKLIGSSWWPAQVMDESCVGSKPKKEDKHDYLVRLYGTCQYLYVDPWKSSSEFKMMLKQENKSAMEAFREVLQKELSCDNSPTDFDEEAVNSIGGENIVSDTRLLRRSTHNISNTTSHRATKRKCVTHTNQGIPSVTGRSAGTLVSDFSRITSWHELAMACGTSKADVSSLHHQKIAHEYYKDARKTARANWLNEQRKADGENIVSEARLLRRSTHNISNTTSHRATKRKCITNTNQDGENIVSEARLLTHNISNTTSHRAAKRKCVTDTNQDGKNIVSESRLLRRSTHNISNTTSYCAAKRKCVTDTNLGMPFVAGRSAGTPVSDYSWITSWHELAMACGTSKADVSSLQYQKIAHEYYKDARKTARANWLNEQHKADLEKNEVEFAKYKAAEIEASKALMKLHEDMP